MARIRFMLVGVLVTLIMLSVAVSPAYARMGMGGGGGGDPEAISGQINDLVAKYNGNHSGLMQAFSGKFGSTSYILVKRNFWSRSKSVYESQIDPQGDVTVTLVSSSGGMMRRGAVSSGYDCDSNICITTTRDDLSDANGILMANSKDYITLDDVSELSTTLLATWGLNVGLFDDIMSWILDEYL